MRRKNTPETRVLGVAPSQLLDLRVYDEKGRCLGIAEELLIDPRDDGLAYLVVSDAANHRWLVAWQSITARGGNLITEKRKLHRL